MSSGCLIFLSLDISGTTVGAEIICCSTKGMPEKTTVSSVEAAGQMYNQTNEFVYLGERQLQQHRSVHRGRPAHTQRMMQRPEVYPQTLRPTEHHPRPQDLDTRSKGTRNNAVRLRHVDPARVHLRYAATSSPAF